MPIFWQWRAHLRTVIARLSIRGRVKPPPLSSLPTWTLTWKRNENKGQSRLFLAPKILASPFLFFFFLIDGVFSWYIFYDRVSSEFSSMYYTNISTFSYANASKDLIDLQKFMRGLSVMHTADSMSQWRGSFLSLSSSISVSKRTIFFSFFFSTLPPSYIRIQGTFRKVTTRTRTTTTVFRCACN